MRQSNHLPVWHFCGYFVSLTSPTGALFSTLKFTQDFRKIKKIKVVHAYLILLRKPGNYSSMLLTYHFKVCLGCVASLNLVVVSLKAPCRSGHHLLIMSLFYHVLEHLMFCSGYYPLLRVLVSLSGEFF